MTHRLFSACLRVLCGEWLFRESFLGDLSHKTMTEPQTIAALEKSFADLAVSEFRGQTRVVVPAASLHDLLKMLKEQRGFDLLVDITCVDYLRYRERADRFGLVYLLANTQTNERITVRTFVNDPEPAVPSVVGLWEGANWLEREVWDMFGIQFLRPSRFAADSAAAGVYRLSVAQGLSVAGPRRATQFPGYLRAES